MAGIGPWIQHLRGTPPERLVLDWIGASLENGLKVLLAGISGAAPTLATAAFVVCILAFILTHKRVWLGRAGLSFFLGLFLAALGG